MPSFCFQAYTDNLLGIVVSFRTEYQVLLAPSAGYTHAEDCISQQVLAVPYDSPGVQACFQEHASGHTLANIPSSAFRSSGLWSFPAEVNREAGACMGHVQACAFVCTCTSAHFCEHAGGCIHVRMNFNSRSVNVSKECTFSVQCCHELSLQCKPNLCKPQVVVHSNAWLLLDARICSDVSLHVV